MKRAFPAFLLIAILVVTGLPPAAAQDSLREDDSLRSALPDAPMLDSGINGDDTVTVDKSLRDDRTEFDIVVGSDVGSVEVSVTEGAGTTETPVAEPEPGDYAGYVETYDQTSDEVAADQAIGDGRTAETALTGSDRPIAMMVENEPPARPQSGLYAADVVFEIIAEEITRFMAVYYDHSGSMEVGPIRSARDYFADISTMFDAFYCHVGGSPRGLQFIKEHRVDDINAIKGDQGFYRTRDRRIPHNLYTRPAKMWEEAARKNYRTVTPKETPFRFLVTPAYAENPYTRITIPYFKSYVVGWQYDPARGVYRRSLNGQPFRAKETEAYHDMENVIIQRIKTRIIDEDLRHEMDLSAGGTAEVLTGGALIVGTWERGPLGDFTYLDEAGREIYLNPGRVWVQFVEPQCTVEIK